MQAYNLKYITPADSWQEALPLGNGKLGAMVYGHTGIERIQLNDDSLWYGSYIDRNNPALKEKLPEIRQLVLEGDIYHAEELIMQYMVGTPYCMRRYSPLGELDIALNQHLPFAYGWAPMSGDNDEYQMDLNLLSGILNIDHTADGAAYHREMFISSPANVMCIRISSERQPAINLDIMLNRIDISDTVVDDDRRPERKVSTGWPAPHVDFNRTIDDNTIIMSGHDAEVEFAAGVRIVCDGRVLNPGSQLLTRDCSEVFIYLASATSNRVENPAAEVICQLNKAAAKGYIQLKKEHTKDFSDFMNRCLLDLGPGSGEPVDTRLARLRKGENDPALAALYFQFGRYLMVSGSRGGSSPLNLQGIWNADFNPMWDSKYTLNINLQMNYWPAEATNLSELHLPFMKLLEKMREKGKETARTMYGMRGMVCHHNTDYYGDCAPQDLYMASTPWVTGGAWMALHIWEHYRYTQDLGFLKSMYPVMQDLADFYEDFLIEVDGKLVTCPSVSPENRYLLPDGYDTPICAGPAMDSQILREFFAVLVKAGQLLGLDRHLTESYAGIIDKLPEDKIGSQGQLLEWDKEYPELTPGMGHVSHLFACYPGAGINWRDTPEFMQAVRKSLELRMQHGAGSGGWPLAWFTNIFARLQDGKMTDQCIRKMLADSALRNFFNARTVFQIDGNLGLTAGMAECLLQSHIGLHFLPALPESWKDGKVTGLRARKGYEVNIEWQNHTLVKAEIKTLIAGKVDIVGQRYSIKWQNEIIEVEQTNIGLTFTAGSGELYTIYPLKTSE